MSNPDSMVSTSSRPLRLRVRPDLTAREQRYLGRSYWVVKEPVGLKYFRFQEEEYAILKMIDGKTSLDEIKRRFESEFRPQKITLEDVHQFVAQLHRGGLVISDAPGQGYSLFHRSKEVHRREWLQKASSVLAMRFKGFDPEWILNLGYPYVRWLFHPFVVTMCLAISLGALLLVTVQFDTFQSRLPSFYEFFGPRNWLLLAVVLGLTKIIHEFGHGFSCKHFGGECHEIGVMILVLTPCLYCNVSDSWLLPNKWHRAAIGAAGMYIEVVMASVATFVWWFTEPGLVNHVALQVMFICSVSTILFNGNPLLRYDGYYILSDILEIPNLRQKSSQILQRMMSKWCLGLELPENPFLPQRNRLLFALYTVASSIYRWVVVLSIMLFLNKVFEPYGLKILGQLIMMAGMFGLVVMPLVQLGRFLYVPGRMDQVKRKNVLATAGVAGAVLAFVLLVPLPHRVRCMVEVRPHDSKSVFVKVPGQLQEILVEPGETVDEGTTLVQLVNHDLQLSLAEIEARKVQQESLLVALRMQRESDPASARGIPAVKEALAAATEQWNEKRNDVDDLDITAPVAGTVIAPPSRESQPHSDGQLPFWSGSPLKSENKGTFLEKGVQLCEIGDPTRMQATLVIDQGDIEFIRPGQYVQIKLDAFTGTTLEGEIDEIAEVEMQALPPSLANQAGGGVATQPDASGTPRPLSTSYVARVPLDNADQLLQPGMRGRAKISTPWQTLGQRCWRLIVRTFRFEL